MLVAHSVSEQEAAMPFRKSQHIIQGQECCRSELAMSDSPRAECSCLGSGGWCVSGKHSTSKTVQCLMTNEIL